MVIKGHHNQDISDHKVQADLFAQFYESLAIQSNEEHFDNDHLEDCEYRYSLINNIVKHTASKSINTKLNEEDIHLSIGKLNTGKISDECTLTAEHFEFAGESIVLIIVNLFNKIIQSRRIPKVFKTRILTPIHKKGNYPTLTTNNRGITVTSVLGTKFEYALHEKMPKLNNNQSDLQFGFTRGLSPIMAAVIVSEVIIQAKQQKSNLYLVTLDSQKAFDVVHHILLLEKFYYEVPPEIWKVIQDLYSDMSSQVKWNGHTSTHFNIKPGVRQGGVLSTHLYKSYINDLPLELEKRGLGLTIGLEYCGSPVCADDIVLMSTDDEEIQAMLDVAYKYLLPA
jgi:hypothetical protein